MPASNIGLEVLVSIDVGDIDEDLRGGIETQPPGAAPAMVTMRVKLLNSDMVGADNIAPKRDLAFQQRTRSFGRFLVLRV